MKAKPKAPTMRELGALATKNRCVVHEYRDAFVITSPKGLFLVAQVNFDRDEVAVKFALTRTQAIAFAVAGLHALLGAKGKRT